MTGRLGTLLIVAAVTIGAAPKSATTPPSNWRAVATPADRSRIHNWREAFVKALNEAKAAGNADAIEREGALLSPDAALADPVLPPGTYACRTIKIGSQTGDGIRYISYRPFKCVATAAGLSKIDGSQRPTGSLFPVEDRRQVFIGTMVLGDENRALSYGRDAGRDMIGIVERVGPQRWRLLLPYPRFESTLDVIEFVPAS